MTIIEMIILTLILILLTNAVAWLMIWRSVKKVEEILTDDIKFMDEEDD